MRRPRFIAEQARDAHGPLGRLVAAIMARETWRENLRAIEALAVQDGELVLDVGCGHGRGLAELARRTPGGLAVGADPSQMMAELAARRIAEGLQGGYADVVVAPAHALPFTGEVFDKVLCVHVVYFWSDTAAALAEIARVMRPGGLLALVFRTGADPAAARFPAEVYRFPLVCELRRALEAVGLEVERLDQTREPILLVARKRALGPGGCEKGFPSSGESG